MADTKTGASRRDFLKLAGAGVPASVVALATGSESVEAEEVPSALGLRKTEHVKKYLESARF